MVTRIIHLLDRGFEARWSSVCCLLKYNILFYQNTPSLAFRISPPRWATWWQGSLPIWLHCSWLLGWVFSLWWFGCTVRSWALYGFGWTLHPSLSRQTSSVQSYHLRSTSTCGSAAIALWTSWASPSRGRQLCVYHRSCYHTRTRYTNGGLIKEVYT